MNSEPRIKYMTDTKRVINLLLENNIDNSSELRSKPTQLNYFKDVNTSLFGTSAYLGSGRSSNFVDKESMLKLEPLDNDICDYTTEKKTQRDSYFLKTPSNYGESLFPQSTRSDYRNSLQK